MELRAKKEHEGSIPTASMADIAFLLIIFFMLTLTYEVDKTQVTLPQTQIRVEIPKKAAYVSIDESGQIKVSSGEELSATVPGPGDVGAFALGVIENNPQKEFVIKADENVSYRDVDAVIDELKKAKVKLIYLLSGAKSDDADAGQEQGS